MMQLMSYTSDLCWSPRAMNPTHELKAQLISCMSDKSNSNCAQQRISDCNAILYSL